MTDQAHATNNTRNNTNLRSISPVKAIRIGLVVLYMSPYTRPRVHHPCYTTPGTPPTVLMLHATATGTAGSRLNMVMGLGVRALLTASGVLLTLVLIWPWLLVFRDRFLDHVY